MKQVFRIIVQLAGGYPYCIQRLMLTKEEFDASPYSKHPWKLVRMMGTIYSLQHPEPDDASMYSLEDKEDEAVGASAEEQALLEDALEIWEDEQAQLGFQGYYGAGGRHSFDFEEAIGE